MGLAALAACSRAPGPVGDREDEKRQASPDQAADSREKAIRPRPQWTPPPVDVTPDSERVLRRRAAQSLEEGRLFGEPDSAIPIYLALRTHAPDDAALAAELARAVQALVEQGDAALAAIDEDPSQLQRAHEIAAVARKTAPDDRQVLAFLERLERVDAAQRENVAGERELEAGRIGEGGGGAIARFREALRLRKGDARALQGLAAAESALIRRAERAADEDDYAGAERWLAVAAKVRPDADTVEHARRRIAALRAARVRGLRDAGIAALARPDGVAEARKHLAALLRIAPPGDPAAAELRERIDLAVHYGLFRPGQVFTDALLGGVGRGPQMVVVPHGAFRMGAAPGEAGATDAERPARNIRFDRGFAMSRHEITVGEFRRFVAASGYQSRAVRRGYSIAYDERGGNLVRRGGVDWLSDYRGQPASESMPVLHVSAKDAAAYAEWLSEKTGQKYRLPSEAEFEYAVRAGGSGPFPWGDAAPPPRTGNFTGGLDRSPTGRRWRNAFEGYGDDAWGPAPVGSYLPNRFGLHDLAGNVSEWVADCWHDSYRRAPRDAEAWVNPGCRTRAVRGGAWASSPEQTRSAWRQGSDADTTNARIGFRVVREI